MTDVVRRIVTHFNYFGIAHQKSKSICQENNLPNHQLVQDVSTCWKPIHYLMERLLEQKRVVFLYITSQIFKKHNTFAMGANETTIHQTP